MAWAESFHYNLYVAGMPSELSRERKATLWIEMEIKKLRIREIESWTIYWTAWKELDLFKDALLQLRTFSLLNFLVVA